MLLLRFLCPKRKNRQPKGCRFGFVMPCCAVLCPCLVGCETHGLLDLDDFVQIFLDGFLVQRVLLPQPPEDERCDPAGKELPHHLVRHRAGQRGVALLLPVAAMVLRGQRAQLVENEQQRGREIFRHGVQHDGAVAVHYAEEYLAENR